jgi:hypothetical protein
VLLLPTEMACPSSWHSRACRDYKKETNLYKQIHLRSRELECLFSDLSIECTVSLSAIVPLYHTENVSFTHSIMFRYAAEGLHET